MEVNTNRTGDDDFDDLFRASFEPMVRSLALACGDREVASHGEDVAMPKKFPAEIKRDVVRIVRRGDLTVATIAADFDISPEAVRTARCRTTRLRGELRPALRVAHHPSAPACRPTR